MKTLHSTSPHFIRCIIPNETKSPGRLTLPPSPSLSLSPIWFDEISRNVQIFEKIPFLQKAVVRWRPSHWKVHLYILKQNAFTSDQFRLTNPPVPPSQHSQRRGESSIQFIGPSFNSSRNYWPWSACPFRLHIRILLYSTPIHVPTLMKCQLIVVFSPFHFFYFFSPPSLSVPIFCFLTSPIPETFGCWKNKHFFRGVFDWQYIGSGTWKRNRNNWITWWRPCAALSLTSSVASSPTKPSLLVRPKRTIVALVVGRGGVLLEESSHEPFPHSLDANVGPLTLLSKSFSICRCDRLSLGHAPADL